MNLTKEYFELIERKTGSDESINLATINPNLVKKVSESLTHKIEAACKAGAKVVCCSEYCYPSIMHDTLSKELAALSKKHHSYIIAGSFVNIDPSEHAYSTSFIFTPSNPEPLSQHKNQVGKILGKWEGIEVPKIKTVNIIHTKYGTVAVLICISTTDRNIQDGLRHLNLINKLYEPIDLVMDIAYSSEAAKMQGYCKYLSGYAKTCVAFVNDMTYGDLCGLYICGEQQTESPHPDELKAVESSYGPIHLFPLNLARARTNRIKELPAPCYKDNV